MITHITETKAIKNKDVRNTVRQLIKDGNYTTARVVVTEVKNLSQENKEINELINKLKRFENL